MAAELGTRHPHSPRIRRTATDCEHPMRDCGARGKKCRLESHPSLAAARASRTSGADAVPCVEHMEAAKGACRQDTERGAVTWKIASKRHERKTA